MSENSKSKVRKALEGLGEGRLLLALIIITSAFAIIATMLYMEHSVLSSALEQMSKNPDIFKNKNQTENFRETFEKVQRSNIDLFNILLPVFGAWVGAVVAFYFTSEHLKKAQDTIDKLTKPEEILDKITVEELLDEYPAAKDVISLKIDPNTKMDEIQKALDNTKLKGGPLLIVDKKQKPLGLLFGSHLYQAMVTKKINPTDFPNSVFIDSIDGVKDFITDDNWTKQGIRNFAELKLNHKLSEAQKLMRYISPNNAVRGLVIENEKLMGIIDHEMIDHALITRMK